MSFEPVFAVLPLQAGGAPPPGNPLSMLVPMAAIFVIFYFLLIRPQQRRQKEQEALLKSIAKGDRVVTTGGLHGTVTGTTDDVLTLEIANAGGQRIQVRVDRARIDRRLAKGGEKE
jgi:preprotein translocase subunit YajC